MPEYNIYTLEDLYDIRSHLNDRCVLMNDIDASETRYWNLSGSIYRGFIPIDNFTGSFIGNNYSIKNLYNYLNQASDSGGLLFGVLSNPSTIITNGTFTGGTTGWTLGTGWAYGSNNVVKNADGDGTLSQASASMAYPLVEGEDYKLTFTISSMTTGSLSVSCAGATIGTYTANGTYTVEFTAANTDALIFTPSYTARLTLDNVILQRKMVIKDLTITNADTTFSNNTYARSHGVLAHTFSGNSYALVSNVKIDGVLKVPQYGSSAAGMIAQCAGFDAEDCFTNVNIFTNGRDIRVGGISAINPGTACNFRNCTASGTISIGAYNWAADTAIGGFVGAGGSSTFTQCKSMTTIVINNATSSANRLLLVGGFAGTGGNMTLCKSSGSIYITGSIRVHAGGFAGVSGVVQKCCATGSISYPTAGSDSRIGGFAGSVDSPAQNCYAWGDVCKNGFGTNTISIGGFAGYSWNNLTNCYSTGAVGGTGNYIGGFIGNRSTVGTITSCYWDKETSGRTNAVGTGSSTGITGKTTAEMKTASTYTGWDFTNIWNIRTYQRGGTAASNLTIWCSASGDYENFEGGTEDDSSITILVPSSNEICWLEGLEALLIGTSSDEWMIASNKLGTPITPTNITVKQQTTWGSAYLQPVKSNDIVLFVDYTARKVRELTMGQYEGKYVANDMTALAEHITYPGVICIAHQKNPESILWCVLSDGSLVGMVYDREQNVVAWFKCPMSGKVLSAAVIPAEGEDEVWLAVERSIQDEQRIYIEKMAPRAFEEQKDAYFLDCGITAEFETPSDTITGLDHLEGQTVHILADGAVETPQEVSGGQIVLSRPASLVHVGLPYSYLLQPMRLVPPYTEGSSMTVVKRLVGVAISFYKTLLAKYGTDPNNLQSIDWRSTENYDTPPSLFSGDKILTLESRYQPDTPFYIGGDEPLPCTVRAIVVKVDSTGG